MICEICGSPIEVIVSRYRDEPYLDGKTHSHVCMLCTSFVQLYYSDAGYGIGTGLVAGIEGIVGYGWTHEEAEHALKCIQKSARGKLVEKVRKPIILSVLVLPPISFLDLGVRELVLRPDDSDVLIELD